jgi:alginate O-acetyltransferase complex protein AlgI
VFFRAPSMHVATAILADAVAGRGWPNAADVVSANLFVVVLIAVFFALHRFDDHLRVKAAVRAVRGEVLWPVLIALWIVAITISQGSSAKFIYFDF